MIKILKCNKRYDIPKEFILVSDTTETPISPKIFLKYASQKIQ